MKKVLLITILMFFAILSKTSAQQRFTISGYIKDKKNGEDLIGATLSIKELNQATASNAYGFYSISVPTGKYTIIVQYVGYKPIEQKLDLTSSTTLNFNLEEENITTEEILVTERRVDANVQDLKMSKVDLNIAQLKTLPALFGEPDLIKLVQLQPGVVSAGEGTSAFFVRGGAADQNLILYDEAPIYDPSHVGGLLSAFNSSIIKSSELYKGGIPAQYGGRLSSVLDIRSIDGNNRKPAGEVSLGVLAARGSVQGPIGKQFFKKAKKYNDSSAVSDYPAKASFMVSGRRSLVGYLFLLSPQTRENNVYFYDFNAKVNYNINPQNRVFVSTYMGRDVIKFGNNFDFNWGNTTGTVRWNHIFNAKLFSNTTLIASQYDYSLGLTNIFNWKAAINEYNLKQDFEYYINPSNTLLFGINLAYREFTPGNFIGAIPQVPSINLQKLAALDNALYLSHKIDLSTRLSVEYGMRLSVFSNVGASNKTKFYEYQDPTNISNIIRKDSVTYNSFAHIKSFVNPEPRLSSRYLINKTSSLKISYNRMVQNVHQIVSGVVPLPTNFWLPSTLYLKPQLADQVAGGYFRNFRDNMFEFSVEGFYKNMQNAVDFSDNANVFLNPDLPVYIRQGRAWSYGAEAFLVKSKGKLTGQIGYTLSWAKRQIPNVNAGRVYYSSFDRRNTLNSVLTYQLTPRLSFGATFTYQTGRPITMATGRALIGGKFVNVISERNGFRLPDFHRLDFSATLKSKTVPGRSWNSEFTLSVYNVYNRKNPFIIVVQPTTTDSKNLDGTIGPGDPIVGTQTKEVVLTYVFPILPSIGYTINF
jgi:hypothetical protein